MAVKVGDIAPDFTLTSQTSAAVSLSDFRGKPLILYFYPKDDTPGCTAESCAFRDQYEVFTNAGAAVVGVSNDSPESHQKFATRYQLPFTLLSDPGDKVRKAYGATALFGFFPGRITYLIDGNGVVQLVFDSMLNFKGHVEESLKALQQLSTAT
jgi:thioredoxin-dependent peroxiredoxin